MLMFITTNTTITMTWTSPSFAPSAYLGYCQCCRLCEQCLLVQSHLHIYLLVLILVVSALLILLDNMELTNLYWLQQMALHSHLVRYIHSHIHKYYCCSHISIAPVLSVSNITISSVEARSMTVSWGDVPCSGQNGPITGYLLYYTNTTFSDTSTITVNITGGDNRQYNLTTLTPYTNCDSKMMESTNNTQWCHYHV